MPQSRDIPTVGACIHSEQHHTVGGPGTITRAARLRAGLLGCGCSTAQEGGCGTWMKACLACMRPPSSSPQPSVQAPLSDAMGLRCSATRCRCEPCFRCSLHQRTHGQNW